MTNNNVYLSAWASKWALAEGEITCAECGRCQPVTNSEAEFKHAPGCKADERPWVVLHDVLDLERG